MSKYINNPIHTVFGLAFAISTTGQALASQSIEEVVVVGQKYERSLQETPQSVSVHTAQSIIDENLINITDVLYKTPNAIPIGGGTGFSLRGIVNTNIAGSGFADLATVYLDNAPLSRDTVQVGAIDTWDLEQVEVLRGPQSTIQGRNSLAGALILQTASPSYEWSGRARAMRLGKINEDRYSVALGGPIIDNQVAFRVAAESSESVGLINNPTVDDRVGGGNSDMWRLKLLIEPSALPDFTLKLSHMDDERTFGLRDAFLDLPSDWNNREIYANRPTSDTAETKITVLDASYSLSDTLALQWIMTDSNSERFRERDLDYQAQDEAFGTLLSGTDTETHELRLNIDAGALTGVMGLYSSDANNGLNDLQTTFFFDVINDLGLIGALQLQGLDLGTATFIGSFYTEPFILFYSQQLPSQIETSAAFGDFNWDIDEHWTLHFGYRYDREEQAVGGSQVVEIVSPLPDPASFPPTLAPIIGLVNTFLEAEAATANSPSTINDTKFNAFLPKLGVSYHIDDAQTLSLIVQEGYRSGGVGTNAARASVHQFDEETTLNYELSYRSVWMDDRLTLNANAYYMDWQDQQVLVYLSPNTFDSETVNAGASTVKGFEFDTNYVFQNGLSTYLTVGYSKTRFDEFEVLLDSVLVDLSGNEFPSAPRWTASTGVTWSNDAGWFMNVNANYTDARFSTAIDIQDDGPNLPARTLVNFRTGWRNDHFGVYAFGRNVFDYEYVDSRFKDTTDAELGRWGEPKILGLSLEANF